MLCGDFNAHSILWGSTQNYANVKVMEELLEEKNRVSLSNGRGSHIDARTGNTSVLDLTLVSRSMTGVFEWEVV